MTILDWIEAKGQVDLGNLTVGLGTVLVAVVSLWVSLKNIKANRQQKIAEFRQVWIDDLRASFADFIGLVYEITNEVISAQTAGRVPSGLDQLHSKLMRNEAYIKLKLNPDEKLHSNVIGLVEQTRGCAAHFSIGSGIVTSVTIDDLISQISSGAKIILKQEWDRNKAELARGKTMSLSGFNPFGKKK